MKPVATARRPSAARNISRRLGESVFSNVVCGIISRGKGRQFDYTFDNISQLKTAQGKDRVINTSTWARSGVPLANGNNSYTATAKDTYDRTASDTLNLSLPATLNFAYDYNGNLTNDGRRVFEYDYENQLTNVFVAGA